MKEGTMAVQVKEQGRVAGGIPVTLPRFPHRLTVVGAGLVASVLLGWLAYGLVTGHEEAVNVQEIQSSRAEAMVQAYETAWARVQPSDWRIAVTGTGPGLAVVADRQRAWAESAITGTGPGLVTIAELQAGSALGETPTGTGPGLEHLPRSLGPETVLIGTP
jgi:hypothetical protein